MEHKALHATSSSWISTIQRAALSPRMNNSHDNGIEAIPSVSFLLYTTIEVRNMHAKVVAVKPLVTMMLRSTHICLHPSEACYHKRLVHCKSG